MSGRAILAALASVLAVACSDDVRSHVFTGRQLEEQRGCLDDVSSIDVVEGPQPGPCEPVCVVGSGDAGGNVYVSTMCPPLPPPPYDTSGTDPRCARALALYQANVTCLDDGGVANGAQDASLE